jgi:mRNA interferase RelE/StbE
MHEIFWKPGARKRFLSLPKRIRDAMERRIDALALSPRPPGCRKMTGYEAIYRIRCGQYRVVYEIRDNVLMIVIIWVGPRGDAYKTLEGR